MRFRVRLTKRSIEKAGTWSVCSFVSNVISVGTRKGDLTCYLTLKNDNDYLRGIILIFVG